MTALVDERALKIVKDKWGTRAPVTLIIEAYEAAKPSEQVRDKDTERTIALVIFQHYSSLLAGGDFEDDPAKEKHLRAAREIMRYMPKPSPNLAVLESVREALRCANLYREGTTSYDCAEEKRKQALAKLDELMGVG